MIPKLWNVVFHPLACLRPSIHVKWKAYPTALPVQHTAMAASSSIVILPWSTLKMQQRTAIALMESADSTLIKL